MLTNPSMQVFDLAATDRPAGGRAAPQPSGMSSTPPRTASSAPRRLDSAALLAGATEIEIEHRSSVYRLKVTSLGKLILTK